jgi:hypothetical protein
MTDDDQLTNALTSHCDDRYNIQCSLLEIGSALPSFDAFSVSGERMEIGSRLVNVLMCHACSLIHNPALRTVRIAVAVYLLIASVREFRCIEDCAFWVLVLTDRDAASPNQLGQLAGAS